MVSPSFYTARFIVLLFVLSCIFSCGNDKSGNNEKVIDSSGEKKLAGDDSLQVVHDIDSTDYQAIFKNKANIWLGRVLDDKQVKWGNFKLVDFWENDSLKEKPDTLKTKFLQDYSMFLRWSPDSIYVLDFGSYSSGITRDAKGQLYKEDGEADAETRLFNRHNKTSRRLLFHGPGGQTWDGRWLDSAQVSLVGIFDTSSNHHPDTLLWLINVKDNFYRRYKYTRQ